MKTTVSDGTKRTSTKQVAEREPSGNIAVPFRTIEGIESIALGFRQQMFKLGDEKIGGSVATGSGLGTDWIILEWNGKSIAVRGLELLKAWVETFAPDEAAQFPSGT